jgi:D-lactate dehydrogenase
MSTAHQRFCQALQGQLPAQHIITDPMLRLALGTDASFYRLIPEVVLRVESEAEVQAVLAAARAERVGLTFRAAGTSLSGQAISDSVLVLLGDGWGGHEILREGAEIRLQPGVIGQQANDWLRPYGRKIGPDPASIASCKIGGIAANNASGMCCGTRDNSYHTLAGLRVILADGSVLDTTDAASVVAFRQPASWLAGWPACAGGRGARPAGAGRAHPPQIPAEEHDRLWPECAARLR